MNETVTTEDKAESKKLMGYLALIVCGLVFTTMAALSQAETKYSSDKSAQRAVLSDGISGAFARSNTRLGRIWKQQ